MCFEHSVWAEHQMMTYIVLVYLVTILLQFYSEKNSHLFKKMNIYKFSFKHNFIFFSFYFRFFLNQWMFKVTCLNNLHWSQLQTVQL